MLRIMESDVRDGRLRGRPQMGWMDNVKSALNERIMSRARRDDCA